MELSAIEMKVDPEVGGWVDLEPYGAEWKGVNVKVRSLDNLDFLRMRAKLVREVPADQRTDGLDPAVDRQITGELLVATVLLDWNGLTHQGEPVPYSREVAERLLLHPKGVRFRGAVVYAAASVGDRGREALEADAKN